MTKGSGNQGSRAPGVAPLCPRTDGDAAEADTDRRRTENVAQTCVALFLKTPLDVQRSWLGLRHRVHGQHDRQVPPPQG